MKGKVIVIDSVRLGVLKTGLEEAGFSIVGVARNVDEAKQALSDPKIEADVIVMAALLFRDIWSTSEIALHKLFKEIQVRKLPLVIIKTFTGAISLMEDLGVHCQYITTTQGAWEAQLIYAVDKLCRMNEGHSNKSKAGEDEKED